MRESTFQRRLINRLKSAGYLVFNISDRLTVGLPDIYCAKDGISHWYELKVFNVRSGKINLSGQDGFTRVQKITIYKLRQAGVDAWGVIHLPVQGKTVLARPEEFEQTIDVQELAKYPEFTI